MSFGEIGFILQVWFSESPGVVGFLVSPLSVDVTAIWRSPASSLFDNDCGCCRRDRLMSYVFVGPPLGSVEG